MRSYLLLIWVACALGQTKPPAKANSTAPKNAAAEGFAVAPMVLKDEGCARDYSRAFSFEA
jgi:hypothetical protein